MNEIKYGNKNTNTDIKKVTQASNIIFSTHGSETAIMLSDDQVYPSKEHCSSRIPYLDHFILVDLVKIEFQYRGSIKKIYKQLKVELGESTDDLVTEKESIQFLKIYCGKSPVGTGDSSKCVHVYFIGEDFVLLKVNIKFSVMRTLKRWSISNGFYYLDKERSLFRSDNVMDIQAVHPKIISHLATQSKLLLMQYIEVEKEKRPEHSSFKLETLETTIGLNVSDPMITLNKMRPLLNYLGTSINVSKETYHDVYLKLNKDLIRENPNNRHCRLKVYPKLKEGGLLPGQLRLELVEHNIPIKDGNSLSEAMDAHQLLLLEVGGWLSECIVSNGAISESELNILNENAELLQVPLKNSRVPATLKQFMQKLETTKVANNWLLQPKYISNLLIGIRNEL